MTVAELIEELKKYKQDAEVVVVGHSWFGTNEPAAFTDAPFITEEKEGTLVVFQV